MTVYRRSMDTPATRPSGQTVSVRFPDPDRTRVEIAARLRGISRSEFVRDAAVAAADHDLARIQTIKAMS